jgi:hypothetical protein
MQIQNKSCHFKPQMMDIADMAILVGGAREGHSFVMKILHLTLVNFLLYKKLTPRKKFLHYQ